MTRLVLFDIDGTLLREGPAPKLAFARALREIYDTPGPLQNFRFAGMTDPECVLEIMRTTGLSDEVILERRDACLDRYVEHLAVEMRRHNGARLFPGVRPLLASLAERPDVALGLLTGNLSRGAALKLGRFDLGSYFPFGAFGDDHHDRSELARIALRKAETHFGRAFSGAETTVVGDTPRDIRCARAIGARAVIVGTGQVSREELLASAPDVYLDSFADSSAAMTAILA